MKYCQNCKKIVEPQKDYNEILLFILIVTCCCPGLIYYITRKKTCPMCHDINWGEKPRENINPNKYNFGRDISEKIMFCPKCGSLLKGAYNYCEKCGFEIK